MGASKNGISPEYGRWTLFDSPVHLRVLHFQTNSEESEQCFSPPLCGFGWSVLLEMIQTGYFICRKKGIPKMEVAPIHPFVDGFSIIYNLSILEISHLSKAPYENIYDIGLKMYVYIYILCMYIYIYPKQDGELPRKVDFQLQRYRSTATNDSVNSVNLATPWISWAYPGPYWSLSSTIVINHTIHYHMIYQVIICVLFPLRKKTTVARWGLIMLHTS